MRCLVRAALGAGFLAGLAASGVAQQPVAAAGPPARPADVASAEAIVRALYDVISADSAAPRDWDRFRSLFAPGARLVPTGGPRPNDGGYGSRSISPEEYVAMGARMFANTGFFERESARRTETFGPIAHVFSTYESRRHAGDAQPFQRGINSIQLFNDGTRWWVVNVLWYGETPQRPVPPRYLVTEDH